MKIKSSVLSQLHDIAAWSKTTPESGPISLIDYVGFIATLDSLFAFAELFFPQLIDYDKRKFLASRFDERVYDDWKKQGRSGAEIQRVMNHLHISSLIQEQAVSDEAAVEAADVIAAMWTRTLGPEGVVVERIGDTFEDAAVTFHEP